MIVLGRCAGHPAEALTAIGIWGLGFGGAPTLIQTALIDAAGPQAADLVSSLQTSAYNAALGGGSLLGGVALGLAGVPALPWAASCLTGAALLTVTAGRRHAFPARRRAMPEGCGEIVDPATHRHSLKETR